MTSSAEDAGLVVRAARGEDLEALRPLWRQIDALHARLQPGFFAREARRSTAADDLRRLAAAEDQRLWVATLRDPCDEGSQGGQRLAGLVKVRIYDTPDDGTLVRALRGHVEELVVDQRCRRRGVGRALMDHASVWLRARGAAQVVLTVWEGNDEAETFYHRLGYRELNRVLGRNLR